MADIDAHLRALTEYKDDMLKRETPLPKASAACPVCGVDRPHGHGQEELITLIVRLRSDHEAALKAAVAAEREAVLRIVEGYQVPVGNSSAGEMACDWTMDALREIAAAIRARGADHDCKHPNAKCVYDSDDGEYEKWECPDCRKRWGVEIPQ